MTINPDRMLEAADMLAPVLAHHMATRNFEEQCRFLKAVATDIAIKMQREDSDFEITREFTNLCFDRMFVCLRSRDAEARLLETEVQGNA